MGTVYLAEQTEPIERQVALKLVHASLRSPEMLARFTAERLAMGRLSHPNVAALHEADATDDGFPYFAMELVHGATLIDYCDTHRLDVAARLGLMLQICSGVEHAHRKGIIHRDLKPGNVLVCDVDGQPVPKVIDFGIAKALDEPLAGAEGLTRVGSVGTPAYISPEALAGADIDTRADVYSLGVILFELLTDQRPRDAGSKPTLTVTTTDRPPAQRPSVILSQMSDTRLAAVAASRGITAMDLVGAVRGDLDWIALKAIADEPDRRYGSAAELAADIRRHLEHRPVEARAPTRRYRFGKFVRRNRIAVGAATLAVVAMLAGIVGVTTGLVQARKAEADARAQANRADREARASNEVAGFLIELFNVSDPGRARGNAITARELLDRGADRIDRQLSDQPLIRARLMGTISDVYEKLSQYDRAVELAQDALALREAELGPEAALVADSLDALGELYRRTSQFARAEDAHRRALAIRLAAFGEDSEPVAESLNGLAAVLSMQGRLAEAEASYRRALTLREALAGARHVDVAETRTHLGWLFLEQERFAEAEAMLNEALAIRREALGDDHFLVAEALDFLATLWSLQGQYQRAEQLTQQALATYRKVLEPGHHDIGDNLLTLGTLYRLQGDAGRATALQQDAIRIFEQSLGPSDREVGRALFELALSHEQLGAWDDAESAYRRALAIYRDVHGGDHPVVGRALNNLGFVVGEKLGRYSEAEALLRRAVDVFDADAEPDSYWDALSRWSLANNLRDQQRFDAAEPYYKKALEILRDKGDSTRIDNPTLAELAGDYEKMRLAAGRRPEAGKLQ